MKKERLRLFSSFILHPSSFQKGSSTMTLFRLCLRNLVYHWRGNSAVLLGVAVGTAVLTGALLVGDALRGSLRSLTLERLGWVDQAMIGGRFIRAAAAQGLTGKAEGVSLALLLRGTAQQGETGIPVRHVNLLGVDERFWRSGKETGGAPPVDAAFWGSKQNEVVLNRTLADALGVGVGGEVRFQVQKAGAIPSELLLGRRDSSETLGKLTLKVRAILEPGQFGSAFSVQPVIDPPRNAFVSLPTLQSLVEQPGRINAIFATRAKDLDKDLQLTLDDWGLVVKDPQSRTADLFAKLGHPRADKLTGNEWYRRIGGQRKPRFPGFMLALIHPKDPDVLERSEVEAYYRKYHPYLSLESRQLLIEPWLARAAIEAARESGLRAAPTLVYLANQIHEKDNKKDFIPYSVVAALDPGQPPPLGPFLPPGVKELKDNQIVLIDWNGLSRLAAAGTPITLRYFPAEQHGAYQEEQADFVSAGGPLKLAGAAADPGLTPEFPGLTDRTDIQSWDPPFPFHREWIKRGDVNEVFWEEYRTTPKAYITLDRGKKLWGSRFGQLTSIRMAPHEGSDLAAAREIFQGKLLAQLKPGQGGLVFDPVKEDGLKASAGSNDFTLLFASFSCFLIAAALLLVGLLFRLNLERRASEVGLLLAAGYRPATVRNLLLAEGTLLAVVGAVLGTGLALLYAVGLLQVLAAVWPSGNLRSFLQPHFEGSWLSLLIGFGGSLLVSVLTIALSLRGLRRIPASALLAGQTGGEGVPGERRPPRWSWGIALVSVVLGVGLLVLAPLVSDHEMKAMTFFGSGALLLTASLAALAGWMYRTHHRPVEGHGWGSVGRLGVRNAARNPVRSLLTAGLLASATFVVVAVDAFRRQADPYSADKNSPSGGFPLVAESDLPIVKDLNTESTRKDIRDKLAAAYGGDDAAQEKADKAVELLSKTEIVSFRVHGGDDTSCLNLYQPRQPRLLGVPERLIERAGFVFAATEAQTDADKANPWLLLNADAGAIPVFGEQNSVGYVLHKSLGDDLTVKAGDGTEQKLRIAGLLQDSVFQNSLLLSEKHFLRLYPDQEGYSFFLIRPPAGAEGEVKKLLETALAERGFEATPTAARLESFLAVENAYLSTFQALGGLGLILGSLGLAVVLLRGVWERRAELALLRALGYRRQTLGWLVLAENGFLLLVGLAAGTLSAMLAVLPHLLGRSGPAPWLHLLGLLGLVLVVGLGTGALAVASTLRAPLVPALRKE